MSFSVRSVRVSTLSDSIGNFAKHPTTTTTTTTTEKKTMFEFSQQHLNRVSRIAFAISVIRLTAKNQRQRARAYNQIRRLWDCIDRLTVAPEPLWKELADTCPWAFRDTRDLNSVIRSFHDAVDWATIQAEEQRS